MKKVIPITLFILMLSTTAFAQVGISTNIWFSSGSYYPSSYYGSGLGWGLGYGNSNYSLLPFLGYGSYYRYDSPYRYQTVTPPNPGLYNALVAHGEEKMAAYYENKMVEQQKQTEATLERQPEAPIEPELKSPRIDMFHEESSI